MNCREFRRYAAKVFRLPDRLAAVADGRRRPHHRLPELLNALLYGRIFREPSLHAIEAAARDGPLFSVCGPISEDTLGRALAALEPSSLWGVLIGVGKTAKRNGMLRSPLLGGKILAAVDGIEVFHSERRACSACCQRQLKKKRPDGELVEVTQYYHRVVALSLVGEDFCLPLGVALIDRGQDEVQPAIALIREARRRYGPRFFDVITADGLYGQPSYVAAVRDEMGYGLLFTLKDNQPNLLAEARRRTVRPEPDRVLRPHANEEVRLWDEPELWWDTADRMVRVVRSVRDRRRREQYPVRRDGQLKIERVEVLETRENFYACLLDPPASPQGIYQAGRSRWDIDTSLFQDLTDNWHLKHMYRHQPQAFRAMLLLLLLAYAVFMFFVHRHVLPRCRRKPPAARTIARRLAESARVRGPPQ
jgi:hypothetical protein